MFCLVGIFTNFLNSMISKYFEFIEYFNDFKEIFNVPHLMLLSSLLLLTLKEANDRFSQSNSILLLNKWSPFGRMFFPILSLEESIICNLL